MKYQKKIEMVDAVQWNLDVDHPSVKMIPGQFGIGWLNTARGGNAVYPNDYILKDEAGQLSSMRPHVFEALYKQAE